MSIKYIFCNQKHNFLQFLIFKIQIKGRTLLELVEDFNFIFDLTYKKCLEN